MNKKRVNIVVNKRWRIRAEQILTTNSQFIHELLTKLSTSADEACHSEREPEQNALIVNQHNALCRALITGYRLGIRGEQMPLQPEQVTDADPEVKYLVLPFCTLGYKVACTQVEQLIQRGHHKSQAQRPLPGVDAPLPDGTQGA